MMPVMDDVQPMTFEVVPPIDCTDPEALSDWTAEGISWMKCILVLRFQKSGDHLGEVQNPCR